MRMGEDMRWAGVGCLAVPACLAAVSACTSYDNVLSSINLDSGATLCPTPPGTNVTLNRTGSGFVLSNGLVTVSIANNGQVIQVANGATPMMAAGDSMYVSESAGGGYEINASSSSVVQQTAEIVELSFVDTSGAPHDMDWDLHYVMRRGVSGFYYFLIAQVGTTTHPNPVTLSE